MVKAQAAEKAKPAEPIKTALAQQLNVMRNNIQCAKNKITILKNDIEELQELLRNEQENLNKLNKLNTLLGSSMFEAEQIGNDETVKPAPKRKVKTITSGKSKKSISSVKKAHKNVS